MSRRAIALIVVFLGVLLTANIIVVAFFLPRHAGLTKSAPASTPSSNTPAPAVASNSSAAAPAPKAGGTNASAGFTVERQVPSASGNLVIKYLRNKQTKTRQIAIADAHQPDQSTVLLESKYSAWALVSPNDQLIAIEERKPKGESNIQLFQRSGAALQFTPVQQAGLQDKVWQTYLTANQSTANNTREGATIDATAWDPDSRKLSLSIAYMPTQNNPDVPAPWVCTYDVASKQVEPISIEGDGEPDQQSEDQQLAASDQSSNADASDQNGDGENDESADDQYPGEKFPATRLAELTVAEVNESSLEDINYAINEMYARHGAEFKDQKTAKEFSEFAWYQPRSGLSLASAEAEFSDLEKANIKVLRTCHDAKVAASKRRSPSHQSRGDESGGEKTWQKALRAWQDAGSPLPPHPH